MSKTPKLYDTGRKTPVSTRPTKQFLQDLNLLMASYRIDATEIVRQSVGSQARAVREGMTKAFALSARVDRATSTACDRDGEGRKECIDCRERLPEGSFNKASANPDGLARYCRSCATGRWRKYNYGLTVESYEALLSAQGGGCAACGSSEELIVDHDHSCCSGQKSCGQCVRGILCNGCNLILGMAQDDPSRLRKVADYIALQKEESR